MAQRGFEMRKADKAYKKMRKDYRLLLYLLPCLVLLVAFAYVPIAGWVLAFVDFTPGIALKDSPFVGLKYFKLIFSDYGNMLRVMRNTVIFALLGYLVAPLSMIFAICLNEIRGSRLKRTIQTITTFPNFISWIIVYALAFQFFSYDGMVSNFLMDWGITKEPTSVLASKGAVYIFQTCMGLWKGLGWSAVIYLAAIAGIDQELFEVAAIDGATRMQRILYVMIPSLMPTFLVLMVMQIGSFVGGGVDQYLVFYNGIVADRIETIDLYVYRATLLRSDYSYGTAIGILKTLISIALMCGMNNLAKKIRGYGIF